ncbi:MAG TPA: hypothetical protein VLF66_19700, partial [Thermoanaerobaculia bacterium]|nr:hypothetical protein [Thermoanaerobaculia bacterium]
MRRPAQTPTRTPPPTLRHPALDLAPERPLDRALDRPGLSDCRRLGLLLQGAALLAHLDTAGAHLVRGWRGAGLAPGGELCGLEAAPGKSATLCQERLRELVALLFGSAERVAGRGEARRAVRRLLERWGHTLVPLPPHRAVTEILEVAPFLWRADGAVDRRALLAELERPGGDGGPIPGRVPLLAGAGAGGWPRGAPVPDAAALREALEGEGARRLFLGPFPGEAGHDPARLAAEGRWRRAVVVWAARAEPVDGEEALAYGEALLALGRFGAAAEVLGELAEGASDPGLRARAEAFRLRCRLLLGELGAVRHRLDRLAKEELPAAALGELAAVAQRVHAGGPSPERGRAWVERALAETGGGDRLRAELVAAWAAWDRGDLAVMDRHLGAARPAAEGPPHLAWRYHQAAGWRALADGRPEEMAAALERALGTGRRLLHRHQAAGLWSDLGVARA